MMEIWSDANTFFVIWENWERKVSSQEGEYFKYKTLSRSLDSDRKRILNMFSPQTTSRMHLKAREKRS